MKERLVTCDPSQLADLRAETRGLKRALDFITKPPLTVRNPSAIQQLSPADLT